MIHTNDPVLWCVFFLVKSAVFEILIEWFYSYPFFLTNYENLFISSKFHGPSTHLQRSSNFMEMRNTTLLTLKFCIEDDRGVLCLDSCCIIRADEAVTVTVYLAQNGLRSVLFLVTTLEDLSL